MIQINNAKYSQTLTNRDIRVKLNAVVFLTIARD